MCSNNNGIKLEINNRNKTGKFTDMWILNNTFFVNGLKSKLQGKLETIFQ